MKKWPHLRFENFEVILPHLPEYLQILIKNKKNTISIYDLFISKLIVKNNYLSKWCNELNINEEDLNKKVINNMPFAVTKDTKLHWFQYRLLHRILPSNTLLSKMHISDTATCTFCNREDESLLHLVFSCHIIDTFWKQLSAWLNTNCQIHINLDKETIILGRKLEKKYNSSINLTLLLAKQFIFSQKLQKRKPELPNFIIKLRYYYKMEKYINTKNNKSDLFKDRWATMTTFFELI